MKLKHRTGTSVNSVWCRCTAAHLPCTSSNSPFTCYLYLCLHL